MTQDTVALPEARRRADHLLGDAGDIGQGLVAQSLLAWQVFGDALVG